MENSSSDKYEEKVRYICENINEIRKVFRKEVLQIIYGSQINENKIKETGCGTQIKIADLTTETINAIFNYIKTKKE